ncbi:hypothetical protein EVAR_96833_1 [Eumeta japonica]|uniref:Uncharacterized protein n=1 Tax=Eumeta variegata TaxID=151549 RepID=A0A4C1WDJ5_EUMVA|nr:hypothetical protein EVAR_96833_1 [Eumeta japonica]
MQQERMNVSEQKRRILKKLMNRFHTQSYSPAKLLCEVVQDPPCARPPRTWPFLYRNVIGPQCPFELQKKLYSGVEESWVINTARQHTWRVYSRTDRYISAMNETGLVCQFRPKLGEFGVYRLNVSGGCSLATEKDPVDIYMRKYLECVCVRSKRGGRPECRHRPRRNNDFESRLRVSWLHSLPWRILPQSFSFSLRDPNLKSSTSARCESRHIVQTINQPTTFVSDQSETDLTAPLHHDCGLHVFALEKSVGYRVEQSLVVNLRINNPRRRQTVNSGTLLFGDAFECARMSWPSRAHANDIAPCRRREPLSAERDPVQLRRQITAFSIDRVME